MIQVLQVGLGPLGQKIGQYISERKGIKTIAAVDKKPQIIGKDFGTLCGINASGVLVKENMESAIREAKPDVAVVSTVSDLMRIAGQLEEIIKLGIPIVSTCEELSYPWESDPAIAGQLDQLAKENGVAVVSTGVNPGFLMDALPTFLTAVCQEVNSIEVKRFQDARYRRLPFQQKIGAGLSLDSFEAKREAGSLRHVGLTESMQLIAHRMGWKLDKTEDIIEPVIATEKVITKELTIAKGDALGVMQTGKAYVGEELKISLHFKAAIGVPESFDEISIKGMPEINSKISGGVNGDVATCAIVINAIPQILRTNPGLKTMADIPLVAFFS